MNEAEEIQHLRRLCWNVRFARARLRVGDPGRLAHIQRLERFMKRIEHRKIIAPPQTQTGTEPAQPYVSKYYRRLARLAAASACLVFVVGCNLPQKGTKSAKAGLNPSSQNLSSQNLTPMSSPSLPQRNFAARSSAAPVRLKTNGVVDVSFEAGKPPETTLRNESTGLEYYLGTNTTASVGGIRVGPNTFIAYNVPPGAPAKQFSNPASLTVSSDTNSLVYYGQMFRWPGPRGTLQRTTNNVNWQDVRTIQSGEVIFQTNNQAGEFLRVKL